MKKWLSKYEEEGVIKDDMGYWNPEKVTEVKKSKIEGNGLFSKKSFSPNDIIGLAHKNGVPTNDIGINGHFTK